MGGKPGAANDYLGAQFEMPKGVLTTFCERVNGIDVHFRMYKLDCRELPTRLVQ
jgi:hypothetical protein